MIHLLYEEKIESYFDPAPHMSGRARRHKNKFISLVQCANGIGRREGASTAKNLQYYKDESIITLYTFVTVDRIFQSGAGKDIWRNIFCKAFRDKETLDEVNTLLENSCRLALETPLPPPQEIKKKVIQWVKANPHPIKYIRDEFDKSRVEDPTMADATLIFGADNPNESKARAMVYFECKFMSDISSETKYHYARNQIARDIDLGRLLYPDGFYFILVTPSTFMDGGSRFYFYKMRDYQGGNVQTLKRDLLFGNDLPDEEIAKLSRRIGWISWEDLVGIIFNYEEAASNLPFEELRKFYTERCLFKSCSQGPT
jgi:hypothetical protein